MYKIVYKIVGDKTVNKQGFRVIQSYANLYSAIL